MPRRKIVLQKANLDSKTHKNTTNQIKQNVEITNDINKEKGAIGGQAYIQGDTAIGTLVLKKDVTDTEAKNISEKYFKQLKKEYKDKEINVQAVRDGKNNVSLN